MKLNILTLVIALLGLSFLGIHYGSEPWTPTRIAGVVIGLPSLALLVLARIELCSFMTRTRVEGSRKQLCPDVPFCVAALDVFTEGFLGLSKG